MLAIPASCLHVHSIYLEHQCFWEVADPGLLLYVANYCFSFLSPCFNQIPRLVAKLNRAHFSYFNRHVVAVSILAYSVVGSWANEVLVKNIRVYFFSVSLLIFELKLDLDGRSRWRFIFRPLLDLIFKLLLSLVNGLLPILSRATGLLFIDRVTLLNSL